MTRSRESHRRSCRKQNFFAVLVAVGATAWIYFSYDPQPAGANPGELRFDASEMQASMNADPDLSQSSGGSEGNSGELNGRMAILMQVLLLEKGLDRISEVPHYTATFFKQEKIDGVLTEPEFMQVKLRHEPFSVYMKVVEGHDPGREVLYVEGENDNEMLVKLGGVKGRMMPALKLDPHGAIAMKEARYPITKLGIKGMIEEIVSYRKRDLEDMTGVRCRMLDNQRFNKKDAYCFLMEYDRSLVEGAYRKTIIYVDKQSCMPICVKNYSWPPDGQENLTGKELDDATLIEFYSFSNLILEEKLASIDFDEHNEKYQFRR